MNLIRRAVPLMIVGLSVLAAVPPMASAQGSNPPPSGTLPPGARLTGECLERIAHATGETANDIGDRTRMTVRRIADLHRQGAPAAAIVQAGENGKMVINARAAAGAARVNTEAAACLAALQQISAPQQFADAINAAKTRSHEAIERARAAGNRVINEAVTRATGPTSPTVE